MRLVIIEDEAAAVQRLQRLLHQVDDRHVVVAALDSISAAVEWLTQHDPPDVVLLDIQLADGSGFEIFNQTEIRCPVIFTTAYNEFAVDAFRHAAIDYLLKPIKLAELTEALSRVPITQQDDARQQRTPPMRDLVSQLREMGLLQIPQRTLVKIGQTMKVLDLNSAAYFYSQDKMTFAVTQEGKRLPVDDTLESVVAQLDPMRFFRINRQIIICIDAIEEMYPYSKSRMKLKLKPVYTQGDAIVSTERSSSFRKWLEGDVR